MRAKDVMSPGVVSVSADAPVLEAARLLAKDRVSALPVVDGAGLMLGIVSQADLAPVQARPRSVADVMTRDVVVAAEDTPLSELARLMTDHDVKRLPIVRNGCAVGIVSRTDLLRALIALESASEKAGARCGRDEQLRAEIGAACRGRSWSRAQQLDVMVCRGVAHLWGVVPSELVRKAYQVAVENVPGVKSVEMHMHVVAPTPIRIGL